MFDKKSDKQPWRGVFLTVLLLKCFNNQCENSFHPTCRPWHKMFYSIQYTLYIIRRIKSVFMQTELDIYAILICHSLHQMNVLITYRLFAGRVAKSNAEFSLYLIKGWVDKGAILAISWQFSQIKLLASKVWTWT